MGLVNNIVIPILHTGKNCLCGDSKFNIGES